VMYATRAIDGRSAGALNTLEHQKAARRIAEEGIVLLKNDQRTLPLDAGKLTSIAVIGENAIRKFAHGGGSAEIKAFYEITAFEGIVTRAGPGVNVTFSQGYREPPPRQRGAATAPAATTQSSSDMIERAVQAAKSCDVVILVGGLNHSRNQDT